MGKQLLRDAGPGLEPELPPSMPIPFLSPHAGLGLRGWAGPVLGLENLGRCVNLFSFAQNHYEM